MKSVVAVVSKAITSKNTLPIMSCVKITCEADDRITLTGGSVGVTLAVDCPATEITDFAPICVEASLLNNALGNLGSQEVEFVVNGNNLTVVYNGGHFNLMAQPATDYPATEMSTDGSSVAVPSDVIANAMRVCRPFVGHDDLRPIMSGVYLDFTSDYLVFAATDGHKLIRESYPTVKRGDSQPCSAIVSEHTASLLPLLPKDSDVDVVVTDRQTMFKANGFTLVATSIEGRYPNYNGVIPQNHPSYIDVDRTALINLLKRVGVMGNKSTGLVKLEADSDMMGQRLTVSSENIDFSTSASETMQVEHNVNGHFAIGFKGEYLTLLLATLTSQVVRIEVADHSRAAVICELDDKDKETLTLLMPMMIE